MRRREERKGVETCWAGADWVGGGPGQLKGPATLSTQRSSRQCSCENRQVGSSHASRIVKAQRDGEARKSVCRSGVKGDPCWLGDLWYCGRPRARRLSCRIDLPNGERLRLIQSECVTRINKSRKSIDSGKSSAGSTRVCGLRQQTSSLKGRRRRLGRVLSRGSGPVRQAGEHGNGRRVCQ